MPLIKQQQKISINFKNSALKIKKKLLFISWQTGFNYTKTFTQILFVSHYLVVQSACILVH